MPSSTLIRVAVAVVVISSRTCESYMPKAAIFRRRAAGGGSSGPWTGFRAASRHQEVRAPRGATGNVLEASREESGKAEVKAPSEAPRDATQEQLRVPLSWDEMIRQVASAINDATKSQDRDAGVPGPASNRLIARVLLPRDAASGDFGRALEGDPSASNSGAYDGQNFVLTPIDESWQGGIMQLYRSAAPTADALLRKLTASSSSEGGLPARVVEDRSVDESGVDGVGLFTTSDGRYSVWVQPTQENVEEICRRASLPKEDRQVQVLLNPQWRLVDDALDVASKGTGPLAGLANFLGGKGRSQQRLAEAGFVPVYTLEGYVCRGSNVRLLQVRGSPWHVFCQRDDYETFLLLGTVPTRPNYQQVDDLLNQADIGYKYARDIGLSPKL